MAGNERALRLQLGGSSTQAGGGDIHGGVQIVIGDFFQGRRELIEMILDVCVALVALLALCGGCRTFFRRWLRRGCALTADFVSQCLDGGDMTCPGRIALDPCVGAEDSGFLFRKEFDAAYDGVFPVNQCIGHTEIGGIGILKERRKGRTSKARVCRSKYGDEAEGGGVDLTSALKTVSEGCF
jgi:hypothetical protein